jgi:hypothetical protein
MAPHYLYFHGYHSSTSSYFSEMWATEFSKKRPTNFWQEVYTFFVPCLQLVPTTELNIQLLGHGASSCSSWPSSSGNGATDLVLPTLAALPLWVLCSLEQLLYLDHTLSPRATFT